MKEVTAVLDPTGLPDYRGAFQGRRHFLEAGLHISLMNSSWIPSKHFLIDFLQIPKQRRHIMVGVLSFHYCTSHGFQDRCQPTCLVWLRHAGFTLKTTKIGCMAFRWIWQPS